MSLFTFTKACLFIVKDLVMQPASCCMSVSIVGFILLLSFWSIPVSTQLKCKANMKYVKPVLAHLCEKTHEMQLTTNLLTDNTEKNCAFSAGAK